MDQKSPILKLNNIHKHYEMGDSEIRAIDGISLDIYQGEFISILGKSGSGKSTLMHIIGLLDHPTTGSVFFENRIIGDLKDYELAFLRSEKIGFVFQDFNLLPRTSALDNVILPTFYNKNISKIQGVKKASDLLEKVDMKDRMKNTTGQLSGGQQQRVAICRALVNDPTLILADEPTGNLDSKSGGEILNLLHDLHEEGRTVIIVTHDESISGITDRVIKLSDGKVIEDNWQKYDRKEYLNKSSTNVTINGIEDNLDEISGIGVVEGRTISKSGMAGSKLVAVIGQTVKKNLFDDLSPIGKTITLKNKKFEVIGVTEKQGAVFGVDQDNEVNIPLNTARQRFQIDRPNFFFIKVDNPKNIDSAKRGIEKAIRKFLDKEDFSVVSQEQSLEFIGNILGVLATALGGIAAISLLVGGVGIMNIMFVSVTERTREIGLRKAVGANSKNILTQFLFEAVILSLLGGLMGVVVGTSFSTLLGNFIDTAVDPMYVLLSFGVSAAIGIIFGVAPAVKAGKMDPITALRYE